jgi:hypothetical protein
LTKSTFLISIYILYIYLQFCRHRYPTSEWNIGDWALGIGHWALGIGHGALGMGHWAWGIGHGALGMGHYKEDE